MKSGKMACISLLMIRSEHKNPEKTRKFFWKCRGIVDDGTPFTSIYTIEKECQYGRNSCRPRAEVCCFQQFIFFCEITAFIIFISVDTLFFATCAQWHYGADTIM